MSSSILGAALRGCLLAVYRGLVAAGRGAVALFALVEAVEAFGLAGFGGALAGVG
ncbi:MAG TPA: hypothetical protein VHA54_07850 [Solirubrobacterales bacterium]|nr:hypothetical protein [Solirubrobacterales bacterium]